MQAEQQQIQIECKWKPQTMLNSWNRIASNLQFVLSFLCVSSTYVVISFPPLPLLIAIVWPQKKKNGKIRKWEMESTPHRSLLRPMPSPCNWVALWSSIFPIWTASAVMWLLFGSEEIRRSNERGQFINREGNSTWRFPFFCMQIWMCLLWLYNATSCE